LQLIERKEHGRGDGVNPAAVFRFSLEERLECSTSHSVKYNTIDKQVSLTLPIPVEKASNLADVDAYNTRESKKTLEQKKIEAANGTGELPVYPKVSLMQCFQEWAHPEYIEGWYSSAVKGKTIAIKNKKFADFPPYLAIIMSKFRISGMTFSKLDVNLEVPDILDIEHLRGTGKQPAEKDFPAEEEKIQFDEGIINSIMEMGFTRTRAEHAAFNNKGADASVAMEWLFSRIEDPALDVPLKPPSSSKASGGFDEAAINQLQQMGFSRNRCIKALQQSSNNVERSVEWLFSHMEEPDDDVPAPSQAKGPAIHNGPGRYRLLGFVTHMGKNTDTGHYVAHVRIGDKWVLYNDSKVTESHDPPRELAYIYFYKREDQH